MSLRLSLALAVVLLVLGPCRVSAKRNGKFFSLFQVINFANAPCNSSSNTVGTCYTSNECSSRGGTSSGTCAEGYGVCCVLTIGCGGRSSENCTYFTSAAAQTTSSCQATICPVNNNICQLRLDFDQFVITGPSTSTASEFKTLFGQPSTAAAALPVTSATQCLTDSFSVTGTAGGNSDVICGTNSGEHLYIQASNNCNQLSFSLGSTATGVTSLANRNWRIKVSQYSCDYNNLAPRGCDQYFFGSNTGQVRSFNFNGNPGYHLAGQDQNICIRRERSNCRICWAPAAIDDFAVSGAIADKGFTLSGCCGYGGDGNKASGFDCVQIPNASAGAGAVAPNTDGKLLLVNAFCGRRFVSKNEQQTQQTLCSRSVPFQFRFVTDQVEFATEAVSTLPMQKGFQLNYVMTGSNC